MESMTTNYSFFKKFLGGFFIAVLLIPSAILLIPEKAEAQSTATACGLGTAIGIIVKVLGSVETFVGVHTSRGSGATGDSGSVDANWTDKIIKCVLKPLAQKMLASMIRQMGANVVNWVNGGGDNGRPLFVTDFKGLLANAADEAIGSFIESSDLGYLCKQGSLDLRIRIALATNYSRPFYQRARCTLTDIKNNINNATAGWDNWLELSTNSQNNFQGAYLIAENQLTENVMRSIGVKSKIVEIGQGFLPTTMCDDLGKDANGKCKGKEITTTPGVVIAAKLNSTFANEDIKAAVATEIDQVLSAVITQIGQKLVSGVNGAVKGLLGMSKGSSYSYSTPYLDSYQSQYYGVTQVTGTIQSGTSYVDQYGSGTLDPNDASAVNNVNNLGAGELATSTNQTASTVSQAQTQASTTTGVAGNIAGGHPTSQTGTGYANSEASNATNGVYGVAQFPPSATAFTPNPFWQVDLEGDKNISSIKIWKPVGTTAIASLGTIQVTIRNSSGTTVFMSGQTTIFDGSPNPTVISTTDASGNPVKGQIVEIQRVNNYDTACVNPTTGATYACYQPLVLDEVQVMGQ
jgi:hypothetical protein